VKNVRRDASVAPDLFFYYGPNFRPTRGRLQLPVVLVHLAIVAAVVCGPCEAAILKHWVYRKGVLRVSMAMQQEMGTCRNQPCCHPPTNGT